MKKLFITNPNKSQECKEKETLGAFSYAKVTKIYYANNSRGWQNKKAPSYPHMPWRGGPTTYGHSFNQVLEKAK